MQNFRILSFLISALCLLSCSSEQDKPETPEPKPNVGIAFGGANGIWQDAPTSRSGETGLETLFTSFRVWGYKNYAATPNSPQVIMDGYRVNFTLSSAGTTESNTADWEYVGLTHPKHFTTQTIKYWDYSASNYRFYAYTPAGAPITPASSTGNSSAPSTGSSSASSGTPTSTPEDVFQIPFAYKEDATATSVPYISDLWFSDNTDATSLYGKCVTLRFSPLIAKVRFKFTYPANTKRITITNILFGDSRYIKNQSSAQTPLKGTITATYPLTGTETPTSYTPSFAWKSSEETDAKGFLGLTIPYEEEGDAIHLLQDKTQYNKWYYVPPFNIAQYNQGAYTISAIIDGNKTLATVPAEYMQWKAGYQYTYIFKITETGSLIAFSELKVEKWLPGKEIDNNGNGTGGW